MVDLEGGLVEGVEQEQQEGQDGEGGEQTSGLIHLGCVAVGSWLLSMTRNNAD